MAAFRLIISKVCRITFFTFDFLYYMPLKIPKPQLILFFRLSLPFMLLLEF